MIFSFFGLPLSASGPPQITTHVTNFSVLSQLTNICSKSTIETLKKVLSMLTVNNKDARTTLRSCVCVVRFKH